MPTVSQFFQPPLYWQQFEDLANALLSEVYNIPDAQQFGRSGQAQDGVDAFGRSKRYGMIGIQCKRLSDLDENGIPLPGGPITQKLLREEAAKSIGFQNKLSIWILATLTAPRIVSQFDRDVGRVGGQAVDAVFEAKRTLSRK